MFEAISPVALWLITGIGLALVEIAMPGFIIGFFSLGAIITALITLSGVTKTLPWQIGSFLVISILSLIFFHLILKRRQKNLPTGETTNFNLQLGKIVPVIQFIDPVQGGGKVRYQGVLWSAQASEKIPPGESVRIKGCENLTLLVEIVKEEKCND